jgi:hypothetical protein
MIKWLTVFLIVLVTAATQAAFANEAEYEFDYGDSLLLIHNESDSLDAEDVFLPEDNEVENNTEQEHSDLIDTDNDKVEKDSDENGINDETSPDTSPAEEPELPAKITETEVKERKETDYRSFLQLYLTGVPRIRRNQIDFYKIPPGFSIYRDNAYFHEGFRIAVEKEIDIENRRVILLPKFGKDVYLYYPIEMSFQRYINNQFEAKFRELLSAKMQDLLEDETRESETGLIPDIVIDLPPMPRSVRRFIGDRPTRLSLSGSQKLTLSGSSTKRDSRQLTETGPGAAFSLDMRQDLNLILRGTIGEKIFVNVRHTSVTDSPLSEPSTIEIEYRGDEDEIVQSIKGGNISLALSGSEFIRYSASSTGLFGVRGDFKIGDLTITAIASKEESERLTRKFTGTDAADSLNYRSRDFVNRTHYYVTDPYDLFALFEEGDDGVLPGYAENAIRTANDGSWLIANPGLLPDNDYPFRVYLDTGQVSHTENTIPGWEIGEDPEEFEPYQFEILEPITDFQIDYDTGILTMNRMIDRRNTIGISYTQQDGVQIGNPDETNLFVKIIRRGNQNVNDTDTWPLQVRNIYNLNRRNIQNDGFRLNFYTINPDGTLNYYVDETIMPGGIEINDYLRLDTNGDLIINGNDRTVNLASGYIFLPFIEPLKAFPDAIIYEQETFSSSEWELLTVNMAVVGKVGRDRIELGQMNLLPGSVRVVVDGETLQENVDYLVDYDFGHISFLGTPLGQRGRSPDSSIEVNYEYRPLFAVEQKTLMGLRADWELSDIAKIGGTFIYHTEKVSDRRPRIGNENRTLLMADIDGRLDFDPPLLTKLVDAIPLVRTDADSNVRLSGEVAMTLPRIYGHKDQPDRKEAYLDDMESIVDTYPLGLTRPGWSPASKPVNVGSTRARPNWYNPDTFYAEDVYSPEFLTVKERRERVQILTLRAVPPSISNPNITNQYWAGIMRYLGNELDFSEKKYIEVLVKVDQYPFQTNEPSVTMHIDLGDISEDFYVWNGGERVLNTEDGANGGTVDGILEQREDVGLDGIPEGEPGDDPWDRFSIEKDEFGDYPIINGTSGNGVLDTEDLNNNGDLDLLNRYFQFTINLNSHEYESEYKGWRLFRIPIDDYIIKTEVTTKPDLRRINFARVWLETEELTRIHIARMDVVGNKWQEGFIKNINDDRVITPLELANNDESMSVGVVDNQNNRDHYVSPPGVTTIEDGVPILEQSLTIDYHNLQQDHYGLTIQRFREAQNLLSYGRIRYWVYLERDRHEEYPHPKGDQHIVFRAGADSLNYYEISYPIEAFPYNADGNKMRVDNWRQVDLDFGELTTLKQYLTSATDTYESSIPIIINGETDSLYVKVRGNRVTLTNIREMSIGLVNHGSRQFTGRLYANEFRVADPYEDIGFAARTTLNTTFADFSTLNVGLVWRSDNFNTSTARTGTARTTNEESISLDITNRYNLQKFLPAGWGLNLPLTLMRNQSYGVPRFKANSDILRGDIDDPVEREREKRESLSQSAELSFSQTVTPSSRWLRYTIKNTSLRGNVRMNQNLTATSADTTLIYTGNMTYNLTLPKEKLGVNIGSDYSIYFFPHTFNNTINYRDEQPRKWRWDTNLPDTLEVKWTPDRYAIDRRDLSLSTTVNHDFTSDLTSVWGFSQKRDLTREYSLWDTIPIGKETERDQNISLNYSPSYLRSIFTLSSTASVRYNEKQVPLKTSLPGQETEEDFIYEFEGNLNRNFRVNMSLQNKTLLTGLMNRYGIKYKELTRPDGADEFYFHDSMEEWNEGEGIDPDGYKHEGIDHNNSDFFAASYLTMNEVSEEEQRKQEEEQRRREEEEEGERDGREGTEPPDQQTETVSEQKIWARLLDYIARIDNISLTYDNNYGSRYSKREERPSLLYQIGFPDQFEDESEELDMKNHRDTYTVATGYMILANLSTTWNYSLTIDRRYSTASQKEVTTVFPNIRVTLTGFERIIRGERFLTSSRLSSNYTFTERVRGAIDWDNPDWDKPTARTVTYNFSPLLSWHANWISNITSTMTYNYSQSATTTFRETFDAVQTTITSSLNANIGYSFRSPLGIKLPFFSKRMPVTNEMSTELGGSWETSKSSNKGMEETIIDRHTEKYTINPRITYNFSRNIKGGLQSSYENSHDKRRDEKLTIFTLSIWAEILF